MQKLQKFLSLIMGMNEAVKIFLAVVATVFLMSLTWCPAPKPDTSKDTLAYTHRIQILSDSLDRVVAKEDSIGKLYAARVKDDSARVAASEAKAPSRANIVVWQSQVDSVKKTFKDSTELARNVIPLLENINATHVQIIANLDQTNKELHIQVADLTGQNSSLQKKNSLLVVQKDALQTALDKANAQIRKDISIRTGDEKYLGFIPKPSRTEVFVGGVLVGSITTIYLTH